MEFSISNKKRKELFISIFQLLKNSSSQMNLTFNKQRMHIQGMDKSHICLFDLNLYYDWFDLTFEVHKKHELCFNTEYFYSIISTKGEDQSLRFKLEHDNADILLIELVNDENTNTGAKKGDYNKFFRMPLNDYDYEEMSIPETDYDAEFSLPSKKISDVLSHLSNFGENLNIKCCENFIEFKTNGDAGEMRVNISVDDLSSYSINEGEEVNLSYSLPYIIKMCITNKLTTDIDFSLSNERPMKISYNLGEAEKLDKENSLVFYIAPKMAED